MDSIKESCMDGITEVGQGKGRSALHKLLSKGTHVDHQVKFSMAPVEWRHLGRFVNLGPHMIGSHPPNS